MGKKRTISKRKVVNRRKSRSSSDYPRMLAEIKERIRHSRVKAALAVNRELIELYWDIGQQIVRRQEAEGWGKSVVEQLSADLKREFPESRGFSVQNLWQMRSFCRAWTVEAEDLQQAVGEFSDPKLQQAVGVLDRGDLPPLETAIRSNLKGLGYGE